MTRRHLILMRHGKATWPEGVIDHQRPLAPRGFSSVPVMARWLKSQAATHAGLKPDLVLVSTARRTQDTFALIDQEWPGLAKEDEPRLYDADLTSLLTCLRAQGADITSLMLVGHNPGMQDLAETLSDPARSEAEGYARLTRLYPTSGIAVMAFEGAWADLQLGDAVLLAFQTPSFPGGVDEE